MKRGFIIVLEIVVLIALLQSSFVQFFLSDLQRSMSDWLVAFAEYGQNKELESLRENVTKNFSSLSDNQISYIAEITGSIDKLQRFHQLYCIGDDKNPYVYGPTLSYFCAEVAKVDVLYTHP